MTLAVLRILHAEVAADDWWSKLSRDEQQVYLKAHPKSRFRVNAIQNTIQPKKTPASRKRPENNEENGEYIVYHGTGNKIDKFQEAFMRPHFFTPDEDYAKGYSGGKSISSPFSKQTKRKNYMIKARVVIKRMCDTKHDPDAVAFYNNKFLPRFNALNTKYDKPLAPPLKEGERIPFIYADDFYRYCKSFGSPYDGMKVDEGAFSKHPAIVPFNADQIEVLKRRILKPE